MGKPGVFVDWNNKKWHPLLKPGMPFLAFLQK
jgi:hypothetical protein